MALCPAAAAVAVAAVASGNPFVASPRRPLHDSCVHCHHAAAVTNCFNIDLKTKPAMKRGQHFTQLPRNVTQTTP